MPDARIGGKTWWGATREAGKIFTMVGLRAAFALILAVLLAPLPAAAAERAIIVLDASGSMWGQIDGRTKIEIARETLATVLTSVPPATELGLMVYGHREKGSCADIELAVPPAAGSAGAITAFVGAVNPKGKTPLSAAVRQAAEALRYAEDKATVILLTDGLETCDADPCALGAELENAGVDLTVHVVGFGLSAEEGKQVACLAENTGGRYLAAGDADQLKDALTAAVVTPAPAPEEPKAIAQNVEAIAYLAEGGPAIPADNGEVYWEFHALDAAGQKAERATFYTYGGTIKAELPPGRYLAHARIGKIDKETEIEAKADAVTTVKAVLDAGIVKLTPKLSADSPDIASDAYVAVRFGSVEDYGYGAMRFYAAAGPVTLLASIGKAEVSETITLKAGETVEKTLVAGVGVVVASADYAEGGPAVDSGDIFFEVLAAKADIAGNRANFGYTYGPGHALSIPAGDYLLSGSLGKAVATMPITVGAGQRVEPRLILNAGVLAIAAPGAERITILAAEKDINGQQKEISANYGESFQETLPPGAYEVRATYAGDRAAKSAPASVTAGQRAEIRVE